MRIAVLIPRNDMAEAQCVATLTPAATRSGHTLEACLTSDEAVAMAPDFVLSFDPTVPKLTDLPTYGLVLDHRTHWLASETRLANLYSYDGYFALTDRLHRFVGDLLFAAGRSEPVGRF